MSSHVSRNGDLEWIGWATNTNTLAPKDHPNGCAHRDPHSTRSRGGLVIMCKDHDIGECFRSLIVFCLEYILYSGPCSSRVMHLRFLCCIGC